MDIGKEHIWAFRPEEAKHLRDRSPPCVRRAVQPCIVISRARSDSIYVNAENSRSPHLGSQNREQSSAAAHIHNHIVADITGTFQASRLHHHIGGFVVAGAERHRRAETEIVPRPRSKPPGNQPALWLPCHPRRSAEKHSPTAHSKSWNGTGAASNDVLNGRPESTAFNANLSNCELLHITFHITFAYHERVIRQYPKKHRSPESPHSLQKKGQC